MELARIVPFEPWMQAAVVEHILAIENGEFDLDLSLADQPDLTDIAASYMNDGRFWVALLDERVIGTLALFDLGDGDADLRKMFVQPAHRGGSPSLAQRMLDGLLNWSRSSGFKRIYLETNHHFKAAMRLYERNGFARIDRAQLPATFPVIKVAEHFYRKVL